jgi:MFS family permease
VALVVAGVLPGFLLASLAPQIRREFALDQAQLGVAIAGFYLVSTLASSPAGRFVDRSGAVAGMRVAAAFSGGVSIAVAVLADGAAALAALVLAAGVGNATAGPAVSAMLHREIPRDRRGLAFGAQQAGAPLGSMLAGLALPAIAIPFGWRWAYASTALIAALAIVLAPVHRRVREPSAQAAAPKGLSSVHALALTALFASAAGMGFISFLVSYSVERGIEAGIAGLLLGLVSACAVVSRLVLGDVADRRSGEALIPVAAMLALSTVGYALLIGGEAAAIVAGAVVVGCLGWGWPGALTLAVVDRTPGNPAWAVGMMMSGLFAGAIVGPLWVGFLAQHGSFAAAWSGCAGLALAAALMALAAQRCGHREPHR